MCYLLQIEYDVDECQDKNDCLDVRRTAFPMEKGGYLIYGVGHQHTGGVGSALYGQVIIIIFSDQL